MKTILETVAWLTDQRDMENENSKEAKGHLWSQAVAAQDAYQAALDFINEVDA